MPTLTPEQTFGFGSIPLTSYFKAPKGGSQNTMFSPQARAMLQQDEAFQQEQMQMEADQLVNDLLGQAPQLTDAQINQALIQKPNIFRGRNAGLIQNYQNFRQQAATPADQKLGMYFYSKLQNDKDPRALQNFQRRMLEEGMTANDAWEAYRVDQFNEPLAQQLAEAGVPREEFDKYRTPTGTFDPVEVSRGIAQTRAAAKASSLGKKTAEPIDEEIELLKDAMEQRKKRLEATGGNITEDTVFKDYADSLDKAYQQKRALLHPPPKPVVGPAAKVPAPETPLRPISPQREVAQKAEEAKKAEFNQKQQVADTEWTNQKQKLYQSIGRIYPDENKVLGIALDIADGLEVPAKTTTLVDDFQLGETEVKRKLERVIADELGVGLNDVAFIEPGNQRTGSQKVTYGELIKDWAKEIKARFDASQSATGQPAPASGKFSVGTPVKVGGP